MKYHCGLRKKDLLNLQKFHKFSNFLGLQVYCMHPILTIKVCDVNFSKKVFIKYFFPGLFLVKSIV